jgi:hypothetical protein
MELAISDYDKLLILDQQIATGSEKLSETYGKTR